MRRSLIYKLTVPLLIILLLVSLTGSIMQIMPRTYTGYDSGKTITVKKGEVFRVKLAENPSTGYAWEMTTSDGLKRISDRYVANDVAGRIAGAGGVRTWDIRAMEEGSQKLYGTYRRPWEPARSSDETFELKINVIGGGLLSRLRENIQSVKPMIDLRQLSFK
jgi:inhibitor of cysteine peptidase